MSDTAERGLREGRESTSPVPEGFVRTHFLELLGSQEDIPSGPPFPRIYVEKSSIERNYNESLGSEDKNRPIPPGAPSMVDYAPRVLSSTEPTPKGFVERRMIVPISQRSVELISYWGPPYRKRYVERHELRRNRDEIPYPPAAPPPPPSPVYLPSTADPSENPEGYVNDHLPKSSTSQQAEAPGAHQGDTPITDIPIIDLETHHLKCRILIQPRDPANFKSDPARREGRREHLHHQAASDLNAVVECIAINQGIEEADYVIQAPLRCRFYYDSQSDYIGIVNEELTQSIKIAKIIDTSADQERSADIAIEPFTYARVGLGAWTVSSSEAADAPAFQLRVYPRTYSLSVLQAIAPPSVAGSKRRHNNSDKRAIMLATKYQPVMRAITSPCDVKGGDILRIAQDGVEQYEIHHLRKLGLTSNADVYESKVSKYPNLRVVVKYITGMDLAARNRMWSHELRLLSQLQCVSQFDPLTRLHCL